MESLSSRKNSHPHVETTGCPFDQTTLPVTPLPIDLEYGHVVLRTITSLRMNSDRRRGALLPSGERYEGPHARAYTQRGNPELTSIIHDSRAHSLVSSFRHFHSNSTAVAFPSSIVPPPSSCQSLCHNLASVRRGALPDLRRVGHPFTSPRRLLELWPMTALMPFPLLVSVHPVSIRRRCPHPRNVQSSCETPPKRSRLSGSTRQPGSPPVRALETRRSTLATSSLSPLSPRRVRMFRFRHSSPHA